MRFFRTLWKSPEMLSLPSNLFQYLTADCGECFLLTSTWKFTWLKLWTIASYPPFLSFSSFLLFSDTRLFSSIQNPEWKQVQKCQIKRCEAPPQKGKSDLKWCSKASVRAAVPYVSSWVSGVSVGFCTSNGVCSAECDCRNSSGIIKRYQNMHIK